MKGYGNNVTFFWYENFMYDSEETEAIFKNGTV